MYNWMLALNSQLNYMYMYMCMLYVLFVKFHDPFYLQFVMWVCFVRLSALTVF